MKTLKTTLILLFMAVLACVMLIPLGYAIITSLVPFSHVNQIPPLDVIGLQNYEKLFSAYPMGQWYQNTIIVTVCTLLGIMLTSLPAGYVLAKLRFPGKTLVFGFILATLMVPFQLLITPLYIMVAKLNWHNELIGLIIPFLVSSLSIFMARQYYMSIPTELMEAARVDGLGYIRTFSHVFLPLSGPIALTLAIVNFTSCWNAYLVPATFMSKTEKFTLTIGLNSIKAANFTRPNETMAGVVLLSIPVLIVFLLLQKWFIQGIAASGSKE